MWLDPFHNERWRWGDCTDHRLFIRLDKNYWVEGFTTAFGGNEVDYSTL